MMLVAATYASGGGDVVSPNFGHHRRSAQNQKNFNGILVLRRHRSVTRRWARWRHHRLTVVNSAASCFNIKDLLRRTDEKYADVSAAS